MNKEQIDFLNKIGLCFDYSMPLSDEQIIELEDKVGDYYTCINQKEIKDETKIKLCESIFDNIDNL